MGYFKQFGFSVWSQMWQRLAFFDNFFISKSREVKERKFLFFPPGFPEITKASGPLRTRPVPVPKPRVPISQEKVVKSPRNFHWEEKSGPFCSVMFQPRFSNFLLLLFSRCPALWFQRRKAPRLSKRKTLQVIMTSSTLITHLVLGNKEGTLSWP